MEINVGQKRRGTAALGRPFFHSYPLPILQHAGVEPFLDQSHDPPICNPVLDEFHQPFVGKPIEGKHDTLPILSTFRSELPSSVLAIRSKAGRSTFWDRCIARVDCISF
jgi:hypothetical protein